VHSLRLYSQDDDAIVEDEDQEVVMSRDITRQKVVG
jgi:hypothetical protein